MTTTRPCARPRRRAPGSRADGLRTAGGGSHVRRSSTPPHVAIDPAGTTACATLRYGDGDRHRRVERHRGEAWVIDRATLEVRDTLRIGGVPRNVAFDATGAAAAIANEQSVTFIR